MTLNPGQIIGGKWKIGNFLGEGACAKVYTVSSKSSDVDYDLVIKVIELPPKGKSKKSKEQERICNTLYYEYVLYTGLLYDFTQKPRLPTKFYGDDLNNNVRYLVMERLDEDLMHFIQRSPPSIKQISEIGLQLLKGLENLHKKGFLFVDLKPENFMLKNSQAYFVDFGLAVRKGSNPPGSTGGAVGTPTYSSLAVLKGNEPVEKDDIESLGFVLLALAYHGSLPWCQAKSESELISLKEHCDINELASSVNCHEIGEIITECRSISSKGLPNYRHFENLLISMQSRKNNNVSSTSASQETSKPIKKERKQKVSTSSSSSEIKPAKATNAVKAVKSVKSVISDTPVEVPVVKRGRPKKNEISVTPLENLEIKQPPSKRIRKEITKKENTPLVEEDLISPSSNFICTSPFSKEVPLRRSQRLSKSPLEKENLSPLHRFPFQDRRISVGPFSVGSKF